MNLIKISVFIAFTFKVTFIYSQNFVWAKGFSGNSYTKNSSMDIDINGNIYTIGSFKGTTDFDPDSSTFIMQSEGNSYDIYISKLDSSGKLLWAKRIGSGSYDYGTSIQVDQEGNSYTTGTFRGITDFNPNQGIHELKSNGESDLFILKLDSNGNFIWVKQIGGVSNDISSSLALDKKGNLFMTGHFWGICDFNPDTINSFNLTSYGSNDIFVSKFDPSGNYVWAVNMGGRFEDYANAITIDQGGNVLTTGSFTVKGDFDPGIGEFILTSSGNPYIFISKLDSNGNFVWAKSTGTKYPSASATWGNSIISDNSGNIYTTGQCYGDTDFDPGSDTFMIRGFYDIFIFKLDSRGDFIWAKVIGSDQNLDEGFSLTLDATGNIFASGSFSDSCDFNLDLENKWLKSESEKDIFIAKYDSNGIFKWVVALGGPLNQTGNCIKLDKHGNIYTSGTYTRTFDSDPGEGIFTLPFSIYSSAFIQKMNEPTIIKRNNNEIVLFPNPVNSTLTLNLASLNTANKRVQVFNTVGQILLDQNFIESKVTVNLENLKSGIYFVRINCENQYITKRIFKN